MPQCVETEMAAFVLWPTVLYAFVQIPAMPTCCKNCSTLNISLIQYFILGQN